MKKIIVALPTCGKTYACKKIIHGSDLKAVDLDIKGSKDLLNQEVQNAQTAYVKAVFSAGCDIVFTHNGALNYELLDPREVEVDVVIRDCNAVEYAALLVKRGDSGSFVKRAYENFDSWTDGMWILFDRLSRLGFKPRMIILGLHRFIWDYLSDDIKTLHCDCEERD